MILHGLPGLRDIQGYHPTPKAEEKLEPKTLPKPIETLREHEKQSLSKFPQFSNIFFSYPLRSSPESLPPALEVSGYA